MAGDQQQRGGRDQVGVRHPPAEGRQAVDDVQSSEIAKPDVHEEWITVEGGPTGSVPTRIVRPLDAHGTMPVILYIHGAGWVFGDAHTHDRLVRDLAIGAHPGRRLPPSRAARPDTGDPTYGRDFARYLTAELACNAKVRMSGSRSTASQVRSDKAFLVL